MTDFLFAVGGGKAIDTVKVVAVELDDKPFFTIPTLHLLVRLHLKQPPYIQQIIIFDGIAFVNHPPVHCFIDADILVEAPSRYLWAGMGGHYRQAL